MDEDDDITEDWNLVAEEKGVEERRRQRQRRTWDIILSLSLLVSRKQRSSKVSSMYV